MATAKKKTASKKRTTKATNTRNRSVSKKKQSDFWTVKLSVETLYWLIFGILVVAIGFWTYNTSQEVHEIYNSINNEEVIFVQTPVNKPTE